MQNALVINKMLNITSTAAPVVAKATTTHIFQAPTLPRLRAMRFWLFPLPLWTWPGPHGAV